jgi:DNA-binding response OmpR family regulator
MSADNISEPSRSVRGRILVVDDDLAGLDVVCGTLAGEGFTVLVATSGDAGLRAATRSRPDLVLLSVELSSGNGLETCRLLKASPDTAAIPVILMTADPTEPARLDGLRAGAVDYLAKRPPWEETVLRISNHAGAGAARRRPVASNQ